MPRLLLIALAALVAALAPATAASADSLVYVKSGTPYISAVDGSDAHVVTNDDPGQWEWASATDGGTVFLAQDHGDVSAYAPGAPGRSVAAPVSAPLGLSDFVVAPDGSSLAYMVLATSPLEHSFVHNTYWDDLADGFVGQELAEYWPAYAAPNALWLGGTLKAVSPLTHTEGDFPPPPGVTDPLEAANDADGGITAYRSGGSVLDFSTDPCPPGATCQTSTSRLVFARYDSTGTNVVGECVSPEFTFQKLAIDSAGTLVAMEEPDGIHETRIGTFDAGCTGFQDLGLVVPGGTSPDFTPSDDRAFPYVAPPSQRPTSPTLVVENKPKPPATTDALAKVTLAKRDVKAGRALTFVITLRAKAPVTLTILRRTGARYVRVGTVRIAGRRGRNRVRVAKVAGHRLAAGRYQARVAAGGAAHRLAFTVTR
jgi:hypothetical protein